jgi:Fe-S cluster assembly protein SufD
MTGQARHLIPQNLPTPREETWKYTNLPRAIPANLQEYKAVREDELRRVIHIKRGEVCAQPVDILWTGMDNSHSKPFLDIRLEEGATLTLIERHEGKNAYWKNMVTQIHVADNAKLNHIRIQNDSAESVNTNMVEMTVGRDAIYNGFTLNLGGKLTRHEIHAQLQGPGGEVFLNGLNLLKGSQHGDTTILIEHRAPNCHSNQFYRTLLDDSARGVFQGKIHVHKVAQKTDGYQLANTILLSPTSEMDTKPELEIYADDVKCSHGTTCGQLDEAPLFYLRTRGLNEQQARLLLVQAFVDEVVEKIADESIRTEVEGKVTQWLQTALSK